MVAPRPCRTLLGSWAIAHFGFEYVVDRSRGLMSTSQRYCFEGAAYNSSYDSGRLPSLDSPCGIDAQGQNPACRCVASLQAMMSVQACRGDCLGLLDSGGSSGCVDYAGFVVRVDSKHVEPWDIADWRLETLPLGSTYCHQTIASRHPHPRGLGH